MKRNGWIAWGIALLLIIMIVAYYLTAFNKSSGINERAVRSTALSLWVYSPGWESYMNEFRQLHPGIEFDVRYFRSSEQLFSELVASISANAAPQLAEIHSFYGILQLAATGVVIPVQELSIPNTELLLPSFTMPFHDQSVDWAIPIGASIPLLYYRNELLDKLKLRQFANWEQVASAAVKSDDDTVVKGPGGLAIDRELPWYLNSMSPSRRASVSMWRDWVHNTKIMKPLSHHKAASDFINGKVGMFMSSSEMLPAIERYVGGKFEFSAGRFPVPINEPNGIEPYIHGMVVMKSSDAKVKAISSFLSYMTEPSTQESLWLHEGMIPVRSDVIGNLEQKMNGSAIRRTILESIPLLHARSPRVDDLDSWASTQALLEQIELDPLTPIYNTVNNN